MTGRIMTGTRALWDYPELSGLCLPSVLVKGLCHYKEDSHLGEEVCTGGNVGFGNKSLMISFGGWAGEVWVNS